MGPCRIRQDAGFQHVGGGDPCPVWPGPGEEVGNDVAVQCSEI